MHNIEHYTYLAAKPKKEIVAELEGYARTATAGEGGQGLYFPIRFIEGRICDGYADAKRYLQQMDRGDYDSLAVRYKELPGEVTSKTLADLRAKCKEADQKYQAEQSKLVVKEAKSLKIGCRYCGSQMTRSFLKTNLCPVCGTDLRSRTLQDKLKRMQKKVDDLNAKIKAEESKLRHGKLMWLVRIEYHT